MSRVASQGGCALLAVLLLCDLPLACSKGETPPRTQPNHPCSRTISRHVRKAVEKEVIRPAMKAGLETWPPRCPFDPAIDLYGNHEKQKQRKRPGSSGTTWTCGLCGKLFKSEHYLDLHLEHRHMNETPSGGVCLADYCEVFEVCHGDGKVRRKDKEPACDEAALRKARRRCEDALSRCFPLDNEASRRLHAQLSRHFCQVLDCRIRNEKMKETEGALMPVIILLILIILVCFLVFSVVVCCVDYSDDIVQLLLDSRLASIGFVKSLLVAREKTRQAVGMDRTKCI
eukprot:TRINITY_DN23678_c0_g1_i1.p1 TRINITY_DN23678_c0_g1~~TRINITY_DN23678_c0_g1_i1.p1  ORF type:complete len:286 (+),score=55.16 TRINITY_DN23678_c0_g1_i1:104-961(+)